ncbi:protein FAM92A [Lingula anatina]|uniref:Protein FAM92A n=1 Tax=Lingula anatina TaxID=7574 RepID=A0A1S3IEE3_LINAN|nr:protein FAM92A [Lingula anatina]|eukprot:XP_013396523.1 protein FAM92A [Lingula anatina]
MTTRNATEIKTSENQSKFIQDRIGQVEKYFGEICYHFGAYARKCAKLRDKGDEVCKSVMDYAINSTLNGTSKTGLTQFAEYLSAVQDYRNAQVQRLEAKVIAPLSTYGNACKHAREDLKAAFAARGKEEKQQKQYDKIREKNPSDRQQISQAETELQKAHVDASRTSRALEEQMDEFEKKKLGDIKVVWLHYIKCYITMDVFIV